MEWVASGGGKITEFALSIGSREGNPWGGLKSIKTAYACRTKFHSPRENREITRIGWTIDGRTCQYSQYGVKAATTFEVLARHPDKAYRLHLGDLKPVPKAGAHRPGPVPLSSKLLGDLPKHLRPEQVVKQVKKVVKKTVRRVRRFFHHRF